MDLDILIDSGYTRCLINLPTVLKLGIHTKLLPIAMKFEQVDVSLIGDSPAKHLTELLCLEMGQHREIIHL